MSIDYTMAMCFGVVIPEQVVNRITERIEKHFGDDGVDEFMDTYCRQINQWSGGDYFFGFIDYLGDGLVHPIEEMAYNTLDFDYLMDEWNVINIIGLEYIPQAYIINFCH